MSAPVVLRDHPRQLAVGALVAGLVLGPRVPAEVLVLVAAVLLAAAGHLLRSPARAALLAVLLVAGGTWAAARTATLDHSALRPSTPRTVSGTAVLLEAPRADRSGGRTVLARWRDEPVQLALPAWLGDPGAGPETSAGPVAPAVPAASAAPVSPAARATSAPGAWAIGHVVRFSGRLGPPDLRARAARAHATIDVTSARPTGERRGGVAGVVDAIRERAQAALAGSLPEAQAGLFRGMVLGQDEALPDDLRDAFRAAGLSHLVAASGANIALLATLGLVAGAVTGLGIRARWVLVLGLIALYVPLAGGGASIQRAGVMGAATIVAALAGRPVLRWYALGLAAVVTLALDPRAAEEPGWQLSFVAVVGIIALAPPLRARLEDRGLPTVAAEAVAVTAAATLATAPLIAIIFGRTSLVALPANVLATPAVAPTMWLGMLAATIGQAAPSLAAPFVALAGLPLGFLTWLGQTAAALPSAEVAAPAWAVAAVCVAAAVAIAASRLPTGATGSSFVGPGEDPPWLASRTADLAGGRGAERGGHEPAGWGDGGASGGGRERAPWDAAGAARRILVVAALAAVAVALLLHRGAPSLAAPPAGTLRVLALDIGQGDATLLQAGGHAVLVDAGPPRSPIVARLRAAGVDRLDAVLATHGSSDHVGGIPAVLATTDVGVLVDGRDGDRSPVPGAVDGAARAADVPVTPVQQGHQLRAGPITLTFLWPPPRDGPFDPEADANLRATVAVAEAYGSRVLLTADAESDVLRRLGSGPVDVLKVAHHGSADEALPGVLATLQPRVAVIEVGEHNSYGHPAPSTVAALDAAVPRVLRTDRDGMIGVELRGGEATVVRPP